VRQSLGAANPANILSCLERLTFLRSSPRASVGGFPGKRSAAIRSSYESMIRQLEDEPGEYDQMKSGALTLPHVERLDQIALVIAKIRIAKGVSQTELARRLGVSKQVISRYLCTGNRLCGRR
jgi:hypothetical protein